MPVATRAIPEQGMLKMQLLHSVDASMRRFLTCWAHESAETSISICSQDAAREQSASAVGVESWHATIRPAIARGSTIQRECLRPGAVTRALAC